LFQRGGERRGVKKLRNAYLNNPFRNEDSFRDNTTVHKGNVSY